MTIWVKTELFVFGFSIIVEFCGFFSWLWYLEFRIMRAVRMQSDHIFLFLTDKALDSIKLQFKTYIDWILSKYEAKKNRRWKPEHSEQQSSTICLIEADLLVSHHRARILQQRNPRNGKENNLDFLFYKWSENILDSLFYKWSEQSLERRLSCFRE